MELAEDQIAEALANEQAQVWIDLPSNIEEHQNFLQEVMHIHPLVIEDMLHPSMLPKVEQYDQYLFLIVHDIVLLEKTEEERLRTHELYILLGKNFVLTARRQRVRAADIYHQEGEIRSRLLGKGVEIFAHALLRRMIDNFFPMLDRIDAKLSSDEDIIFNKPKPSDLQRVFSMRKDIMHLRAIAQQHLDVFDRIVLGEFDIISDHGVLLARDLYDHLFRVSEKASGFREIISGLLDAYLSQMSNRMSEIMKVLTVIATIMLPLSIVVGYYGMNFKNLPGLTNPHGWIYTLIVMGVVITGMLGFFKYKRWL
jgi:magnesium transporter